MPASRTIIGRRPARSESRQGQRTFEQVAERIREQLAAGALTAGDKLPTERDMAEHFQVGRNAVREALRTLEMAGVIRLEKGRNGGAYICPPSSIRVTVAMRDLLNFGSISLDEIAESRTMLMDLVTRVVCERATPADLDALEQIVAETDRFTRSGQLEKRAECIARFYAHLGAITGNRVLVMMVTSLSEIVRRFLDSASLRGRPLESLVPSFQRFIGHLRARRADDAAAELRQHLIATHKVIQLAVERAAGVSAAANVTVVQRPRRPKAASRSRA
jgi:DNA-binding FadR family transcriptional regulator